MSATETLAPLLVRCGIRHAFGVTGSGSSWRLITSLEAAGVEYTPVAHEAAGALMAGAVFRSTGALAAAISIKGPGVVNMLPGICYNAYEGNAVVTISEAYGSGEPSYRRHKRLDHHALIAPIAKGFCAAGISESALERVLMQSKAEIPGPVHIDLTSDEISEIRDRPPSSPNGTVDPGRFVDAIQSSSRPVVIVGSLALRRRWRSLLAKLQVPVFTTAAAKGALDECLPQSAGVFTGAGRSLAPETFVIPQADAVFGFGLRNTEVLAPHSFGRPTHMMDEVEGALHEGFDASVYVSREDQLAENGLSALSHRAWGLDLVAQARARLCTALTREQWSAGSCFVALNQLSFDHVLVVDTGSFCTVAEHLWNAGERRPYLGSGNSRFMGVSLPTAIGAAIANRDAPIMCCVGDGGVRPYVAELRTAVDEQLRLCVVLMSDGRYGSIACTARDGELSARAVDIQAPSWAAALGGFGWDVSRVRSLNAFRSAVENWRRTGPLFIEASFDQIQYAGMTKDLR